MRCHAVAAAAALALGAVAQAQPQPGCDSSGRQQIAMVNYFSNGDCTAPGGSLGHRTIVNAPLEICHTVPNSTYGGYRVSCDPSGARGAIQFCSTNRCSDCQVGAVAFGGRVRRAFLRAVIAQP